MNRPQVVGLPLDMHVNPAAEPSAGVGQEHDRGLGPLGLMQAGHPHDIGAAEIERR